MLAILAIGAAVYATRIGGWLAAGLVPADGAVARLLRLAPGNLFAAFAAAQCVQGGILTALACAAALAAMAATHREWAALGAGAGVVALGAWLGL